MKHLFYILFIFVFSAALQAQEVTITQGGGDVDTLFKLNDTTLVVQYADGALDTLEVGGGSGGSNTASNGLTLSSSNIKLGGTLTENTTITGAGYDLFTSGLDSFYLDMDGVRLDLDGEKLLHFPGVPGANPINSNIFFGPRAGSSAVNTNTGYANTGIGAGALSGLTLDATGGGTTLSRSNTGIGYNAGAGITTGTYNTLVGTSAGSNAPTTSFQNSGFGQHALISATGNENSAFGANAGGFVAAGNAIFGASAVLSGTGSNNSYFGYKSGENATSGSTNAAFGYLALRATQTSSQTAFGAGSLQFATTATENVSMGYQAGNGVTTSVRNVYVGYQAGLLQSLGGNNVGVGALTVSKCTNCTQNTVIGTFAFDDATTGTGNTVSGYVAMSEASTGDNNSAYGTQALRYNTSGYENTAVGRQAGNSNTTGNRNSYVGSQTGRDNTTGTNNTVNGYSALALNIGSNNVAIGSEAAGQALTVSNITSVGVNAAKFINKNNSIAFGYGANSNVLDTGYVGTMVFGYNSRPTANYQILLGDANGAYTQLLSRNYAFNIDQTLGVGQDNYLMTYNNTSGEFEAQALAAAQIPDLSGTYFVNGGNSFDTTAFLGTADAQPLAFKTNNTTRRTYDASGNVTENLADFTGTYTDDYRLGVNDTFLMNANAGVAILRTTNNIFEIEDDSTMIDQEVYLRDYGSGTTITGTALHDMRLDADGKIIPVTLTDTVYLTITPLALTDSLKTVANLANDSWTVPAELNGYKIAKVQYAVFQAGAGTGSTVVGLRRYSSTRSVGYSNGYSADFAAGDLNEAITGSSTLVTGDLYVFHVNAHTMVTAATGLTATVMLTK